jgi:hypothetical protein
VSKLSIVNDILTWACDGATQITPTGSPSTEDVISSVELVTSKNNNGQICDVVD